jgi:hypothetical protein
MNQTRRSLSQLKTMQTTKLGARTALGALAAVVTVAGIAGCGKPNAPSAQAPSLASAVSTASAGPTTSQGGSTEFTREPCELLNPALAREFAGDDAQRQLTWDSTPPLPVGDDACAYKSSTRTVSFYVDTPPSDPNALLNHFHVINPANQVPGLAYDAYWFGAGQSLVVVKNGLVLGFKVSDVPSSAHADQWRQADEIRLADQIVPRVG